MKQFTNWSPLHFLAALGAGGIAVSFFMYLLFWVPHPNQPIPVFNDWVSYLQTAGPAGQAMIFFALGGIILFASLHFHWLFLNFKQYRQFKAGGGVEKLIGSNAHTQLMAIPLTVAMSINVGFIIAAVFIPGLWGIIEWLFPVSMLVFVLLGIWASRIYLNFFSHVLHHGSFDNTANNSLAQLLPSFAFVMIGVGLSAPAAMSHNEVLIGISYLLTIFFISSALFMGLIKLIIGFNDMFKEGASRASLPTLWVVIPILTITGIATMRLSHGLHTLELGHGASNYVLLTAIFSLQIMFALMGWAVMKRMNYFQAVLKHEEKSPVTFALICPGVALTIMGHFVLNKVIVASGIISQFGIFYMGFSLLLIALQLVTAWLLIRLVKDHLADKHEPEVFPANTVTQ
ncbi:MAG: hypothetical protein DRQ43_06550 [Gammaproteobacteria bacterium]|nr:MAG: hypothetical protein DRQ43_06550 [Gammaproteobacteria bacterium]